MTSSTNLSLKLFITYRLIFLFKTIFFLIWNQIFSES